jgi:predicted NUDIX family phosphoesterase
MMTASPEVALQREAGPVPVRGKEGGIMNTQVLEQMRAVVKNTATGLHNQFRFFDVDTSAAAYGSPERTVTAVLEFILTLIEEQLAEEILGIPKKVLLPLFSNGTTLVGEPAQAVLAAFRKGSYGVRASVEACTETIQALPVAVVRNKTGHVLLLRRREKPGSRNRLHEELVIWAGGHVRREDSASGRPLEAALARELQEELRLCIEENELRFLGAVYSQSGGNTGKHVALVYEWKADTDDVAVALSSAEFFERRGTSLSGRFVPMKQVVRDIQEGKLTEPWSTEIARSLLTNGEAVQARLL